MATRQRRPVEKILAVVVAFLFAPLVFIGSPGPGHISPSENDSIDVTPLSGFTPASEDHFELSISDGQFDFGPGEVGIEFGDAELAVVFPGSHRVAPVPATMPTRSNYYIGQDPANWVIGHLEYDSIIYPEIYDQIDLVYMVDGGQLKYEFHVRPGGSVDDIELSWMGHDQLVVGSDSISLSFGSSRALTDDGLVVFQEGSPQEQLAASFRPASANSYGFQVPEYDHSRTLIIDPYLDLVHGSLLGSTEQDFIDDVVIDQDGYSYVVGRSWSASFPKMNSVLNNTTDGEYLFFVTKFLPDLSDVVYSTVIGTSIGDHQIDIDQAGNVYVVGNSDADDLPLVNATDSLYEDSEAFVIKLDPYGNLVYSTYLGGDKVDYGRGIAALANGTIVVVGSTFSTNFPATQSAYQTSGGGLSGSGWVAMFDPDGTMQWASFLGNSLGPTAVAFHGDGIIVVGWITTFGGSVPLLNPYDSETNTSATEGFITRFTMDGTGLTYSSYFGGDDDDRIDAVAISRAGNIIIGGTTSSIDFAYWNVLFNVFTSPHLAFVTELNITSNTLVFSTKLGSEDRSNKVTDIAVDEYGKIYAVGETGASSTGSNLSLVHPLRDFDNSSGQTGFAVRIGESGSSLDFSTLVGGYYSDRVGGIDVHNGTIVVAGGTESGMMTTTGVFQENTTSQGQEEGFVWLLNMYDVPDAPPNLTATPAQHREVLLEWDTPEYLGGLDNVTYNVYRSTFGPLTLVANNTTANSFSDIPPTPFQDYTYKVRAVNSEGESADSEIDVYVVNGLPPAPHNILPTITSDRMPNITWEVSSDPDLEALAFSFALGTGPDLQDLVDWTSTTSLNFEIPFTLLPGSYHVQVRAHDPYNWTLGTAVMEIANIPPGAPVIEDIITFDPVVNFSWLPSTDPDGDDNLVTYEVRVDGVFDWHSSGTNTNMTSPVAIPPGTYLVQVRAFDGHDHGPEGTSTLYLLAVAPEPRIAITSPDASTEIENGTMVWVNGTFENLTSGQVRIALGQWSAIDLDLGNGTWSALVQAPVQTGPQLIVANGFIGASAATASREIEIIDLTSPDPDQEPDPGNATDNQEPEGAGPDLVLVSLGVFLVLSIGALVGILIMVRKKGEPGRPRDRESGPPIMAEPGTGMPDIRET